MKNMYTVIGIVAVLLVGGLGVVVMSGDDTADQQNKENLTSSNNQTDVATQQSPEDEELMRFVEKESIEYKNALSFQGEEYDQYFIANMIHYSEGIAQLETLAANSSSLALSEGAADRAKQAREDTEMYKNLQKEMGQPASYGDQMQYHAAMGADAEVYFSVSALDGLAGSELEAGILKQLKYFRRAETLLSGAGINNAVDQKVKTLVNTTLATNAVILERM